MTDWIWTAWIVWLKWQITSTKINDVFTDLKVSVQKLHKLHPHPHPQQLPGNCKWNQTIIISKNIPIYRVWSLSGDRLKYWIKVALRWWSETLLLMSTKIDAELEHSNITWYEFVCAGVMAKRRASTNVKTSEPVPTPDLIYFPTCVQRRIKARNELLTWPTCCMTWPTNLCSHKSVTQNKQTLSPDLHAGTSCTTAQIFIMTWPTRCINFVTWPTCWN